MSAKKAKYYVVWVGAQPGVYTTWEECQAQVKGHAGAKYKAFESMAAAQEAFQKGPEAAPPKPKEESAVQTTIDDLGLTNFEQLPENVEKPVMNSLAVDAACSGNPGVMEYQGVYVPTRSQVFHFKAPLGTNNIGEFLAIVHGLAYIKKNNLDLVIYSDSVNAINWVRNKRCRTKLPFNDNTAPLYEVIQRAEAWLHNNTYTTEIRKWETELWGEIPADFQRKKNGKPAFKP